MKYLGTALCMVGFLAYNGFSQALPLVINDLKLIQVNEELYGNNQDIELTMVMLAEQTLDKPATYTLAVTYNALDPLPVVIRKYVKGNPDLDEWLDLGDAFLKEPIQLEFTGKGKLPIPFIVKVTETGTGSTGPVNKIKKLLKLTNWFGDPANDLQIYIGKAGTTGPVDFTVYDEPSGAQIPIVVGTFQIVSSVSPGNETDILMKRSGTGPVPNWYSSPPKRSF